MTLGIIGTAGRGPDGDRLKENPAYYRMMLCVAQTVSTVIGARSLVSGGAALSDHVAVRLFLDGHVNKLTLHLPVPWIGHGFKETGSKMDTGRTSNWYHTLFSQVCGIDSLAEIQQAIEQGATIKSGAGGFKERNTDIANEADVLLAFTFSGKETPNDGGTGDTWSKFAAKAQAQWDHANESRMEAPCGCYAGPPSDWWVGYHFDLLSRRLSRHVFEDKVTVAEREERRHQAEQRDEQARPARSLTPRTADEERLDLL